MRHGLGKRQSTPFPVVEMTASHQDMLALAIEFLENLCVLMNDATFTSSLDAEKILADSTNS